MGNSGSNEVTIEKDGDKFIETGDGIKLSPNLVERMSYGGGRLPSHQAGGDHSENEKLRDEKLEDALKLAEECQKMLDTREKQMSHLNEKWKADIEDERAKHKKFYDLSLDEFEKSAAEAENKFKKPTLKPVCANLQSLLVECYQKNSGRILECSEHVQNFQKCVNDTKQAYLKQSKADSE